MIKEQYVSFETARLLKEKGFNEICIRIYRPNGDITYANCFCSEEDYPPSAICNSSLDEYIEEFNVAETDVCSAPTQSHVMRWLREVHRIDIIIDPHEVAHEWIYQFYLYKDRKYLFSRDIDMSFENTAEEAIKYCLENLI